MNPVLELDFVLVSNDYATLSAVSAGVKRFGATFRLVPTAHAALEVLARRKIDGVFVDLAVPGALDLLSAIRKSSSNARAVIFALLVSAKESTPALNDGANFLLRKPITVDAVVLHITIAKELMVQERRRYFRHPVDFPVRLNDGKTEQRARITNLSDGGMAVRTTNPLARSAVVDFAFDLSFDATLTGKGQVTWSNSGGMVGILLQTLHGTGREQLKAWLRARDQLSSGTAPAT